MMYHENNNEGINNAVNGFKVVSNASSCLSSTNGLLKKRSYPSKVKLNSTADNVPLKQSKMTDSMKKSRKSINRYFYLFYMYLIISLTIVERLFLKKCLIFII